MRMKCNCACCHSVPHTATKHTSVKQSRSGNNDLIDSRICRREGEGLGGRRGPVWQWHMAHGTQEDSEDFPSPGR